MAGQFGFFAYLCSTFGGLSSGGVAGMAQLVVCAWWWIFLVDYPPLIPGGNHVIGHSDIY